jgi:hypothetical protein
VNRRTLYELLATTSLAIAGVGGILAAAGAVLQQVISVAAATLCTLVFLVPGLYFLEYAQRLKARDLALAHTAAYATARGTLDVKDLAAELSVSGEVATKILRTAVREGHLRGRFDERGRFVAETNGPGTGGRTP